MKKETLIIKIQSIVEKLGGNVDLTENVIFNDSPCISSIGSVSQFLETFGENDATVVTYVNGEITSRDTIEYDLLSKDDLEDSLFALKNYKIEMDKFYESCRG